MAQAYPLVTVCGNLSSVRLPDAVQRRAPLRRSSEPSAPLLGRLLDINNQLRLPAIDPKCAKEGELPDSLVEKNDANYWPPADISANLD